MRIPTFAKEKHKKELRLLRNEVDTETVSTSFGLNGKAVYISEQGLYSTGVLGTPRSTQFRKSSPISTHSQETMRLLDWMGYAGEYKIKSNERGFLGPPVRKSSIMLLLDWMGLLHF